MMIDIGVPQKPKIVTAWLFTKKCADLSFKWSVLLLKVQNGNITSLVIMRLFFPWSFKVKNL